MKLRCLVIDDKPLAIDILAAYIGMTPFLEFLGSTTNPITGLTMLNEQSADLIFLDIQMPELTGLQFINIIDKRYMVILTTAYENYALNGFEHDVTDYLLKPIAYDRFYKAAEKALKRYNAEAKSVVTLPAINHAQPGLLFVKTEHRIQKLNLDELLFVKGLQNYIHLQTTGNKIISLQTMITIEEQLPSEIFMRVHRSYIVNLRHIDVIERARIYIGDDVIPVGDSYREAFYSRLNSL